MGVGLASAWELAAHADHQNIGFFFSISGGVHVYLQYHQRPLGRPTQAQFFCKRNKLVNFVKN